MLDVISNKKIIYVHAPKVAGNERFKVKNAMSWFSLGYLVNMNVPRHLPIPTPMTPFYLI